MITIQNQNFGVEIELTGITRQAGAVWRYAIGTPAKLLKF